MKVRCFHNAHQAESRDLVAQLEGFPNVEILDFMKARSKYLFQGTPCVWVGGESPEQEAWSKSMDVSLQQLQEVVVKARALTLSLSIPGPYVAGASMTFIVVATDIENKPASLPDGLKILIGQNDEPIEIPDGEIEVTFQDPGLYSVEAQAPFAVKSRKEVQIIA